MIHFLYLIGFSLLVAIAFGVLDTGNTKDRLMYSLKVFAQFVVISLVLAWILYFFPW